MVLMAETARAVVSFLANSESMNVDQSECVIASLSPMQLIINGYNTRNIIALSFCLLRIRSLKFPL